MITHGTRSFRGYQVEVLINHLAEDGNRVAADLRQLLRVSNVTGATLTEIIDALNAPLIELKTPLERAVEPRVAAVSSCVKLPGGPGEITTGR